MKKNLLYISMQLLAIYVFGQPYVDPIQVRYNYAFRSAGNVRGTAYDHLWVGSDLPIKIRNKTYLLLSPYYENWQIDSGSVQQMIPALHGLALPIGLMIPLKNKKWVIVATVVPRTNGEKLFADNTFQFGGAGFVSYETKPGKKIRAGVYMNSDFFGFFFMPLLGADWKMNDRNYFFGLLPGRFTWEHKFNSFLYGGITFRAITNSYRLLNKQYVRIDDNQLSLFLDAYPAKRVCFTVEPGYGVFRKLRAGIEKREYFKTENWGDGLFIKLSASYRIRLSNNK